MNLRLLFLTFLLTAVIGINPLSANPAATTFREAAELIFKKFGKGAAGQTVEEVTKATAKAVAKHGDEALPLLRNTGHAGFTTLKQAGNNAPDVIKLYARKGNEALWVISEPKKLAIFIKHGDSAADALLRHPGIADSLIGRYGNKAVGALNNVSRQSAQRLGMVVDNGLLTATERSSELLSVIRRYGDEAMDFIWRNKGSLAVTSVLVSFLADPQVYISGARELVIDPVASPVVENTNWTLLIAGVLVVAFMPFIARSIVKARSTLKAEKPNTSDANE